MATAKVMHGARAKLAVAGQTIGIFTNVSYGLAFDAQAVTILGSFAPVEIGYTGQEPVSVTASGWRVVDAGPHQALNDGARLVPFLQDLLNHQDITLSISDRQTGKEIMTVTGVRPTGYSTSMARGLQEVTINFMGLRLTDESGSQGDPGASQLP